MEVGQLMNFLSLFHMDMVLTTPCPLPSIIHIGIITVVTVNQD